MGLRAKRLVKPTQKETSGVDHPAHKSEGWWIFKEEGDPDPDMAEVLAALDNKDDAGAPPPAGTEAAPAADTEGATVPDAPKPDTGTAKTEAEPDVAKQLEELRKELATEKAEREKAETARKALADAVVKSTGGDPTVLTAEAIEKAEFDKAVATLPEPVAKAWLADRERLAKAEQVAKAEHDARISREYLEKAEGFKHLPANRETLGTVLRAVESGQPLTTETAAEVTRLLKAADNAMGTSGIFTPHGGAGEPAKGGAYAELTAKAEELRKADPALAKESAVVKAMSDNPELARRYHEEMRNGV